VPSRVFAGMTIEYFYDDVVKINKMFCKRCENPVKLHFDPDQAFQRDAINSVIGIFEGQPLGRGDFDLLFADTLFQEAGIGNHDDHFPQCKIPGQILETLQGSTGN
jgi:hypothetical protein